MLSVASVPQSYPGERLRIAPAETFVPTGKVSSRAADALIQKRKNYFRDSANFR